MIQMPEYGIDHDGCWIILKSTSSRPRTTHKGVHTTWARVSAENKYGDISGRIVRHTCDNSRCINPDHLVLGTHADNVADRVNRGRSASGKTHGRAKLTWKVVRELEALVKLGWSYAALGRKYGVTYHTISDALNSKTWK